MNRTIEPLTESTAADFFDFFDHRAFSDGSPYAPCYCSCFQLTADEVRIGIGERAAALGGGFEGLTLALRESAEGLIKKGILHGYLAYEDGLAIGWCNANDQQNYIRVGSFNPGKRRDEDCYISPGERGKIKSLVCFEIAPDYRGKGVAKALLHRVCEDAKAEGFALVEVYPQVTEAYSPLDFNGPMKMYADFGFEEYQRHGKTIIMRKKLIE
ncbi:MAG: GNAT family N-acetyltransferase [Clostridia bacterium]|nr:GNAT family N-acetyltransferase [Clostridia bacterium]